MLSVLLLLLQIASLVFCGLSILVGLYVVRCRIRFGSKRNRRQIAFFHPYCSAGGGGERVLWKAIHALGELRKEGLDFTIVIYTIDAERDNYKRDVLEHVRSRFSIVPLVEISFVHLDSYRAYLDRASRFSMIVESFGTMKLAYKALEHTVPDVFFDTTGCAFTFFVARVLAGCKVAAYVHYPTISTDMLKLVWERRPTYNNDTDVASSSITTYTKLIYYTVFALTYGCVGSMARLVMVNSRWTYSHIAFLWRAARPIVVYPPCDVESLQTLPLNNRKDPIIVSIGQFRPEKDHKLQIRSFARLLQKAKFQKARLVLVGSCRGTGDDQRVRELRGLVTSLDLTASVDFVLNQPYSVVKEWFGKASVGLHTMWNEHFGIGVVEMMAAGLIVVAHASGGPKEDILVDHKTGFLAANEEQYATCFERALEMPKDQSVEMRQAARESAAKFSDQVFNTSFKTAILESKILVWRER